MDNFLRALAALLCLCWAGETLAGRASPQSSKSHGKSLAKVNVHPSIANNYVPPKSMAAKKAEEIEFYKQCMYGETELERTKYVLALNAKWRFSPLLSGAPEKQIGRASCRERV